MSHQMTPVEQAVAELESKRLAKLAVAVTAGEDEAAWLKELVVEIACAERLADAQIAPLRTTVMELRALGFEAEARESEKVLRRFDRGQPVGKVEVLCACTFADSRLAAERTPWWQPLRRLKVRRLHRRIRMFRARLMASLGISIGSAARTTPARSRGMRSRRRGPGARRPAKRPGRRSADSDPHPVATVARGAG